MSCMKKMVSANKALTYAVMCLAGILMSFAAAKIVINHCCCAETLKSKARRALKNVEEKML